MSQKPTSTNSQDVLQFLDSLDTYNTNDNSAANLSISGTASVTGGGEVGGTNANQATDTQSVLDFLDQITQKNVSPNSNAETTPSTTNVNFNATNSNLLSESSTTTREQIEEQNNSQQKQQQQQSINQSGGPWSWGGLLATATTAYKTASTVVDTSVKGALATAQTTVGTVRANETTKKLEETVRGYVNKEAIEKIGSDLKTLGLTTINTVVNAVAPPIAEHEVVEVWLAHDMVGYVGVELLVYKAFMKIMEQVEGGDIVVRRGNEPKKNLDDGTYKDLNLCEGFAEAVGLATPAKANPYSLPVNKDPESSTTTTDSDQYLFYVIVLTDPTHNLNFKTFSQSLPMHWLDIPYEMNEWVEEKMVEALKLAVQAIAQDYVWARMTGDGHHPPVRVEVPIVHV
ncbi:1860_t:CDS:2 [Ambispora gerdemannii]|uniref:1860_t:CDS:1 n=1 Tax=Ambispora gerdemannii TaxID=144530 RepID=A0A9N8W2J0_9GLOM|nr:1860_t:CDS:2 [Ambispora gerdemannii]